MKVYHIREYQGHQTIGGWHIYEDGIQIYKCSILELPWKDNERNVSCIPEETYNVVRLERSGKFAYPHFHILDVTSRDWIKVHRANYVYQLQGCQAVGQSHMDINGDGWIDVTRSRLTLNRLIKILPDEFELKIIS